MQVTNQSQTVRRRRVFYIPGYDPFHPRRYREMYRSEGAAQAENSGYEIGIIRKEGKDTFGWHATAKINGTNTAADIDVLVWSDIVRTSMSHSILATYWQLLRTVAVYLFTGTFRRLMWMRKGPVIAALYPVGMLLIQLVIGLLLGAIAVGLIESALAWLASLIGWGFAFHWLISWALVFGATWFVLKWFKAYDNRIYAYYLMHDYAYSARWTGAYPRELEDRLGVFGDIIANALDSDVDEVLVVGHSSGAHLAMSIIADLDRGARIPKDGPRLGLLSLGQVVPMIAFLPKAQRLRRDLRELSQCRDVTWVDVTAPGDGCSFALCDPVAVSGVADVGKLWPVVMSAAFTNTLSPERWKALRWRFFRLHFQYLCAFDRPADYDYFQITCGPQTLAERFGARASSKSRIDVPASKYTSTS